MIKIMKYLFTTLILFTALTVNAASSVDPIKSLVTEAATQFMQENDVPGVSIQLYVNGEPHTYYFGYADPETEIPVTDKTIFEIGSISKVMTAILFAQQLDAAKMHLNDPIKKYLPNLNDSFAKVTLQELATHTAGLAYNAPRRIQSQTELKSYLSANSPRGIKITWGYSNVGIGLLTNALQKVTKKNFQQLYITQITKPLNMQPIGLIVPKQLKSFFAQGYDREGNPVPPRGDGLFPSAYSIKIAASDSLHFLSAAIGLPGTPKSILYPIRMTESAYVAMSDKLQGLGWQMYDLTDETIPGLLNESNHVERGPMKVDEVLDRPIYDGDRLIDKVGKTRGFHSYIAVIPNKKSGLIILANKDVPNGAIVNMGRALLFNLANIKVSTNGAVYKEE